MTTRLIPRMACVLALTLVLEAGGTARSHEPVPASMLAGLSWRSIGPFDGGPIDFLRGEAGVPGKYWLTTPSGGAWQTFDGGETWTNANPGRSLVGVGGHFLGAPWVDPQNPRRIAKKDESGIVVSLDGGATWTTRHNLPIAEIDRVTTVGGDPYWIVATEQSGRAVAVPSRDEMTGGAPDVSSFARSGPPSDSPAVTPASIDGVSVNVVRADPIQPALRFAGTARGVSVSFNAGVSWTSLDLNLPSASVRDLAIHGNDLIAATYGWSVWVLDDITPLRQIAATTATSATVLFKPATAIWQRSVAHIDFYLRDQPKGDVRLEIVDATGRVVHTASSVALRADDPWMPLAVPLPRTAGGHRISWDCRMDAPPAPSHRYARLAPVLAGDPVSEPLGPAVLPGTYQVRLIVDGIAHVEPLMVKDEAGAVTPAFVDARRRRFELALTVAADLRSAHAAFLQLTALRAQVKPLLGSKDEALVQMATDFDATLATLDGSDWNSLLLPDFDSGVVFFEDKDTDEDPAEKAVPVALTQDYDDPTMVVGLPYENATHAPALAIVSASLASVLTHTEAGTEAPTDADRGSFTREHDTLQDLLASWTAVTREDLPRINAELIKRKLRALTLAATSTVVKK